MAYRHVDEATIWREHALTQVGSAVHRSLVAGAIVVLLLVGLLSTVVSTPYVLADPLLGGGAGGLKSSQTNANWLRDHYHGGRILASTVAFAALTFFTGLPDNNFLNESTKPDFNDALAHPQAWATWIVIGTDSAAYDPVYDHLMTRGNTSWLGYYTLAFRSGSIYIYKLNT